MGSATESEWGNVDKIAEKFVEKCGFLVYNGFSEKIKFSGSIISLWFYFNS